LINLLLSFN